MLKLVGTQGDVVQDERVLLTDEGKPTPFLIGWAVLELACDVALAYAIYRVARKLRG